MGRTGDGIPFAIHQAFLIILLAMRVLSAAKPEQLIDLSMTFFKAAWVDDLNISEPEVVSYMGDGGRNLLEATQDSTGERKAKRTTQMLYRYIGAPAFVVGDACGNDSSRKWLSNQRSQSANKLADNPRAVQTQGVRESLRVTTETRPRAGRFETDWYLADAGQKWQTVRAESYDLSLDL